jgi:hypothetical protein
MNEFEHILRGVFQQATSPLPGDRVIADLGNSTSVKGTLKALPNASMNFCVVDGTISKQGHTTYDKAILVPFNLIKHEM